MIQKTYNGVGVRYIRESQIESLIEPRLLLKLFELRIPNVHLEQTTVVSRQGLASSDSKSWIGSFLAIDAISGIAIGKVCSEVRHASNHRCVGSGILVVFNLNVGDIIGVIESETLTAIRTAVASCAVLRLIRQPIEEPVCVFGCGTQALWHIRILATCLGVSRFVVCGRSEPRVAEFVRKAVTSAAIQVDGFTDAKTALNSAGPVVVCVTNSPTPLFPKSLIQNDSFIIAVGSNDATVTELNSDLVMGASCILIDDASALTSGDLGAIQGPEREKLLRKVLNMGQIKCARNLHGVRIWKSVGSPYFDLWAAAFCLEMDKIRSEQQREL